MKINEIRDIFEKISDVSSSEDINRVGRIIDEIERRRSEFDKSNRYDQQLILPGELFAVELLKQLINLPQKQVLLSYAPLHQHLAKFNVSLTAACSAAGIPAAARKAIGIGVPIHMEYLMKLAILLECDMKDLFYEIDFDEYTRRLLKGNRINTLKSEYAKLIEGTIHTASDKSLEDMSDNDFFLNGFSFGDGLTIESVEKLLGLVD